MQSAKSPPTCSWFAWEHAAGSRALCSPWGLLSIAMMFVRTPREFYLARLALGAAEAGFFPGVIFYISQWFPAAAQSRAISRFYVAIPLSSVVMGALAGMLLNLNGGCISPDGSGCLSPRACLQS